jgi:subtilisin family serine protease
MIALPGPGLLTLESLRPRTGRGVRVAVIDSGAHAAHPHVGGIAGGAGIDALGTLHDDWTDRLGHGTAVTAVIREKAPEAEIVVAKVFDRSLDATAVALVAGIDWAVSQGASLINLSLGTTNPGHALMLAAAVGRAHAAGAWIVAAGLQPSSRDAATASRLAWLPGSLPGVVAVELDWTMPRDQIVIVARAQDVAREPALHVRASGYPRPIPGVAPERNLRGVSFAVANVTGLLAVGGW